MQRRLKQTRWPSHSAPDGWIAGTDQAWLKELVGYWAHSFDWRAQEERINQYPQFMIDFPETRMQYLHIPGEGESPYPLLVLHGWPGSIFEFEKIIPMLTQPSRFGGKRSEAFTLVVPNLPGFGPSFRQGQGGLSFNQMGEVLSRLMTHCLGYKTFGVQGGDLGATIASTMSIRGAGAVAGIHLNYLPLPRKPEPSSKDAATNQYNNELATWLAQDTAYASIQGSRPETLAISLNDSPAGLASWMVEKMRAWSDCGGNIENVFTKDEILANVSMYWLSGTIGTSFYPYYWRHREGWPFGPERPITCPTGYCEFPKEILRPPRRVAERTYQNIARWTVMQKGGHFAAWEQPEELSADVREFFRTIR